MNLHDSDKNHYPHFKSKKTEAEQIRLQTRVYLTQQSAMFPSHYDNMAVCCHLTLPL